MKCLIYDTISAQQYDSKKEQLLNQLLRNQDVDFTFGLGSGQLRALGFAGAYAENVVGELICKREAILADLEDRGSCVRIRGIKQETLEAVLSDIREKIGVIRLVDEFGEGDFLVSGTWEAQEALKTLLPDARIVLYERYPIHTILCKDGIAPYSEVLRTHLIYPYKLPVIKTRNARPLKQADVAQELVDRLTLPQHFMSSVKAVYFLGVREFILLDDNNQLKEAILAIDDTLKVSVFSTEAILANQNLC